VATLSYGLGEGPIPSSPNIFRETVPLMYATALSNIIPSFTNLESGVFTGGEVCSKCNLSDTVPLISTTALSILFQVSLPNLDLRGSESSVQYIYTGGGVCSKCLFVYSV
jgi:hypothetical protein